MKRGVRGGPRNNRFGAKYTSNKPILVGVSDSTAAPQIEKLSQIDLTRHV